LVLGFFFRAGPGPRPGYNIKMQAAAATVRPADRHASLTQALLWLVVCASWLGVVLQLGLSARLAMRQGRSPLAGALDALCFFTVLTNLLVAVVTTARASARATWLSARSTLAAVAVYIFVVGLIYSLLLRATWAPTGLQKAADVLLHDAVPVLYVLWWLTGAPKGGLRWRQPLQWLAYPCAYCLFAVLLGEATGRYLYPFANIAQLGWGTVGRNAALIFACFWILGVIAVFVDRQLSRRSP
jgi:hypothetical protein